MSSQVPPDPITDTFNPSAWNLPELSPEEEAELDKTYVKYPIAQNRTITFPGGISTSTVSSTGTGASNILNIGVAPRTLSGAIHHYSDGDNCVSGTEVDLNNGVNNNSATSIHNGTGANASGVVNIMAGSSNSGTITIGNETTNNTTMTIRGNTTITKPIFSPITLSTFSAPTASQMYSTGNNTTAGFFTFTAAYRAFAPLNNLTKGTYLFFAFVYMADYSGTARITCSLCYSGSTILNNQLGGFNVLNDNTLEAYGYKSTTGGTGGNFTLNISGIYTVLASPNNNVAMAVSTVGDTIGAYVDLKYCRIG